jgi:ArsR family transcriptional regulator
MDSAEFLDLLGNDNRRRILRLLARKPCYVTEISEQLGVSPKAVIDHLGKLEDAGLVESRTDDRRRKYFSISRHVSLEVTVSPYEFGTRSAYPSSNRLDITTCRQVTLDLESVTDGSDCTEADERTEPDSDPDSVEAAVGAATPPKQEESESTPPPRQDRETNTSADADSDAVATLARQLRDFEQLERELSLLHRWAEGRITDLRERLADRVDPADPRLVSEVLVALADDPRSTEELCRQLRAPSPVVEELLGVLAGEGIVRRDGRHWHLAD